jgi:ADP-heptose:LPS heptosyltransferase
MTPPEDARAAGPAPAPPRRLLLLQCRNYGDAVIGTGLIEALGGQGVELHVLARPRFAALFRNNPHVAQVHTAEFPMGTAKQFGLAAAAGLAARTLALRRQGFDRVVNLCGDFREIGLGWAIAPRGNCGPIWPARHPRRQLDRAALPGLVSHPVAVPPQELGIYAVVQRIAAALGAAAPARSRLYDARQRPYAHAAGNAAIGLHPLAGVTCKQWPAARWRALVGLLREQGRPVLIFGAPVERERLAAEFDGLLGAEVQLASGSLDELFERLCGIAAFVGLDSFGIHAAQAIGTPSLMLNGGMLAPLVVPPDALLLDGGAGLPCHPCYNRPSCVGSERPYRCMLDLPEQRVVQGLRRLLGDGGAARKL